MAWTIFGQLDWLTTRVKRLCCAVDKIKESGAGSYKVYTALLKSDDLDNPVVLKNSLGEELVWTNPVVGQFVATVTNNIFLTDKMIGFAYSGLDDETKYIPFIVTRINDTQITLIDPTANVGFHLSIRIDIRVYE